MSPFERAIGDPHKPTDPGSLENPPVRCPFHGTPGYFGHNQNVKRAASFILVVFVVLCAGSVAKAHDPIILTDDQTVPEVGPFLPDGTISFALYGSFGGAGETRGLRCLLYTSPSPRD